jgi:hypothetical protein
MTSRNETPVTQEMIAWMQERVDFAGAAELGSDELVLRQAILSHLRASAAKGDVIPAALFDGYAVFQALSQQARSRTGTENVSDVLDAVVRLLRAAPGEAKCRRADCENGTIFAAGSIPALDRRIPCPDCAPGEAKCENDELRKQVAALSKIDEQGMGHDDALSAIAGHVHEIKVLCDAFGYDPSQWLQDEAANGIDCAPSPEQLREATDATQALPSPEQQGAEPAVSEQMLVSYLQDAIRSDEESVCWLPTIAAKALLDRLRAAPSWSWPRSDVQIADIQEAINHHDSMAEMQRKYGKGAEIALGKHLRIASTLRTLRSLLERVKP